MWITWGEKKLLGFLFIKTIILTYLMDIVLADVEMMQKFAKKKEEKIQPVISGIINKYTIDTVAYIPDSNKITGTNEAKRTGERFCNCGQHERF